MKLEVSSSPRFSSSPFPYVRRVPGLDATAAGKEFKLRAGMTTPDYIREAYGINRIEPLVAPFSFLNRDDKFKTYSPGDTDPFVFKSDASIPQFHASAKELLVLLTDKWKGWKLPVAFDKDRQMELPDVDSFNLMTSKGQVDLTSPIVRENIASVLSNVEIMKKAALCRTVTPGWWIVSYAGSVAKDPKWLYVAADILSSWMVLRRSSSLFQAKLDETIATLGDPLDTSVGFPLYSAQMTAAGEPLSKLKVLEQYKNIWTTSSWSDLREAVASRGTNEFERTHLFCVAPIRRIMPGYKWSHIWQHSSTGLVFSHDQRGNSTNRVAWMAPYLLNLMLAPIQAEWKTFRKLLPGLMHDGETRRAILHGLRTQNPLIIESDFSNYDRSIPNDVMTRFFYGYTKGLPDAAFYFGLLSQTHKDLPIAWSDQLPDSRNRGWVFNVPLLALLSGLKITSEIGTFENLIINIAGRLQTGFQTRADIFSYLDTAFKDPKGWVDALSEKPPGLLIQSDDTALISKDPKELNAMAAAFEKGSADAGISSEISRGDKFLMRHMTRGADLPVAARIFQNTLSNEEPVSDPLKFLVGLAVRTDGLFGWKTFDPFQTGTNVGVCEAERDFSIAAMLQLRKFVSTSARPLDHAVTFLDALIMAGKRCRLRDGLYYTLDPDGAILNEKRLTFLKMLAQSETEKLKRLDPSSMLLEYYKNVNSPSAAVALQSILAANPGLASTLNTVAGKEHTFFTYAMNKVGIPLKIS